ncbi:alpha/beta hydrolase [Deinococcus arboris]|nr:alpha/beta hydrolase-fold protein [Deinococcus arboris]
MRVSPIRLSAALLSLTLLTPAFAGGAGGPRALMPDFSAVTPWPIDCHAAPTLTDGCRLRVPIPAGTMLPTTGQFKIVPGTNQLTVLYRAAAGTGRPILCCGLQIPLAPLPSTDVWAATVKVNNLNRAVISLQVLTEAYSPLTPTTVWRGPQAPAPVPRPGVLAGQIDRFSLTSDSVIGPRDIRVYTPPRWTNAERLPAVYMADGQAVEEFARTLEAAMARGTAPRVILVGISSAQSTGVTGSDPLKDHRALEYLEGLPGGAASFAAHEQFVLSMVLPHVEQTYHLSTRPQGRVVAGFSNGAAWAISMAARHPQVFRGVVAMSPGSGGAQNAPHPATRVFVEAGTLEPLFLNSARTYAANTRLAGNPTHLEVRVGGHDEAVWRDVFPSGVAFALNH